MIPIDSDPATDENHGQVINWELMVSDGLTNGQKILAPAVPTTDDLLPAVDRTRNLVWGAERPELLITETMATHDLSQEDLATPDEKGDNTTFSDDKPDKPQDDDLDQRLRPRGSLFVEVHNPWSADAQHPAELYSKLARNPNGTFIDANRDSLPDLVASPGLELGRLSTHGETTALNSRRSPVWRMAVVEEFPEYRNPNGEDSDPNTRHTGAGSTTNDVNSYRPYDRRGFGAASDNAFRPTDPDWDEMLVERRLTRGGTVEVPMGQWQQQRTGESSFQTTSFLEQDQAQDTLRVNLFSKPYPYIEREFYFTSGNHFFAYRPSNNAQGAFNASQMQRDDRANARTYTNLGQFDMSQLKNESNLRIPFSYVQTDTNRTYSLSFRFLAWTPNVRFAQAGDPASRDTDVAIAPILPGRYAVIGSAGTAYTMHEFLTNEFYDGAMTNDLYGNARMPRFVTTLGRVLGLGADPSSQAQTNDDVHVDGLERVRRIELCPHPDPNVSQVLVAANGAFPTGGDAVATTDGDRDNEIVFVDASAPPERQYRKCLRLPPTNWDTPDRTQDRKVDATFVAPAVAIPVDDMNISEPIYGYEVAEREREELEARNPGPQKWNPDAASGEGAYTGSGGFAAANNSQHFDLPFDIDPEFQSVGSVPNYRVLHLQRLADPSMPWNPPPGYNAHRDDTFKEEHNPNLPVNPYLTVDSASVDLTVFNGTSSSEPKQLRNDLHTQSKERGAVAVAAGANNPEPQRVIWKQEPASAEGAWAGNTFSPAVQGRPRPSGHPRAGTGLE